MELEKICSTCSGRGKCQFCRGISKVDGKSCKICDGTGKCRRCHGSGEKSSFMHERS